MSTAFSGQSPEFDFRRGRPIFFLLLLFCFLFFSELDIVKVRLTVFILLKSLSFQKISNNFINSVQNLPSLLTMLTISAGISPNLPAANSSCRETICNASTAE